MPVSAKDLAGARILVAEDDYLLATELCDRMRNQGAEIVGPAATLAEALQLLAESDVDGAVVDIDLRGERAYPLLDALLARGVKTVITTGYDSDLIPLMYRSIPIFQKPLSAEAPSLSGIHLHRIKTGQKGRTRH